MIKNKKAFIISFIIFSLTFFAIYMGIRLTLSANAIKGAFDPQQLKWAKSVYYSYNIAAVFVGVFSIFNIALPLFIIVFSGEKLRNSKAGHTLFVVQLLIGMLVFVFCVSTLHKVICLIVMVVGICYALLNLVFASRLLKNKESI